MTNFSSVYPRLVVRDAAAAIDFYVKVFDAEELDRYNGPDGGIVHAMLRIGGVQVAVKDEDSYDPGPQSLGGSPVIMAVEVDDADAVGERMLAAGSTVSSRSRTRTTASAAAVWPTPSATSG